MGILTLGTIVVLQVATGCVNGQGRSATVLHEYTLPPYSLTNWGYSAEELRRAAPYTLTDCPAIGSGLQWVGGNRFVSVTDRGPIVTPGDKHLFPLPGFTPTIVLFRVVGEEIVIESHVPMVLSQSGPGATGIPNNPTNDATPYVPPATLLPFNPNGLDVEDIARLSNGQYLAVEEYSPSVVVISASGVVLKRYIPAGKKLPGAAYPVNSVLPSVFDQTRLNRGFESVAVSPDGRAAYTLTQSPLGPTGDTSPYKNSRVLRLLRLDVTDPLDLRVTGQFIVQTSPVTRYPAGTRPDVLKVSAAAWVAPDKLLFLERTGEGSEEGGKGGAKLILVDIGRATDVSGMPGANTLVLERAETDLAALGIVPALSTEVLDLNRATPEITERKLEGLAILNAREVAISNDNDFGVTLNAAARSKLWVIRLRDRLPLGR